MSLIKTWFNNARPQALVQSVLPAVLAFVLAIGVDGFKWWLGIVAIIGVALAHLAMNLADDYFDYQVDMHSDREKVIRKGFRAMTLKYPYLTDGSQTPQKTLLVIIITLIIAALCGLGICLYYYLTSGLQSCIWIIAIAAVTLFLGIFYSAPPFKIAYRGLGEPLIGLVFGPMLMMGVYYSATGTMNWDIVILSIPIGILVMNILYTHSFLEIHSDEESNKMTLARLLKTDKMRLWTVYILNLLPLVFFAFAIQRRMIGMSYMVWVGFYLIIALWLCKSLKAYSKGEVELPEKLPAFAKMPQLEEARAAGIDWFVVRWMVARNLLGLTCLSLIIFKIIELCIL